jgi:large subunit ribosomal protein L22
MTHVKAQLNGLRISPRKVRLVVGLIRKKRVQDALNQLSHMAKRSAGPITKLLSSAIANAQNNFKLDHEHLWISEIIVDEGVKLKRWQAKGFGRPNPIEKKTSRVRVTLEHRAPADAAAKTSAKKVAAPEAAEAEVKEVKPKRVSKKKAAVVEPTE